MSGEKLVKLLLVLFLQGCITYPKPIEPKPIDLDSLKPKRDLYLSLMPEVSDQYNFLEHEECDSLLWTSLAAYSGHLVDVTLARTDAGAWFRTPEKDCYADGRSGSTISKDMLLGLIWYAVHAGEKDLLERLWDYGSYSSWRMGSGPYSRTVMTPQLIKTLAMATGRNISLDDALEIWPAQYGYRGHLMVLHLLLRYKLTSKFSSNQITSIIKQYRLNPNNALYNYAYHKVTDGDQQTTLNILDNHQLFPEHRLPTEADRCSSWLWRHRIANWEPCPSPKRHTGGDYTFMVKLLENDK